MSDAPEASKLQPITINRVGILWAIFWPFHIKYSLGRGEPRRATSMTGLSKSYYEALSRCPDISQSLRFYQYRCYFMIILSTLAGGLTFPALAIIGGLIFSFPPFSKINLVSNDAVALLSFVLVSGLLLIGLLYLLTVDLLRDFYRLVDRYNAYVAEQAKAKSGSPAPPAQSLTEG